MKSSLDPEIAAAQPVALPGAISEVSLLIPNGRDCADPELSIVIPALDEAATVGEFVDWCLAGMPGAGISGEVLLVDSSGDDTPRSL